MAKTNTENNDRDKILSQVLSDIEKQFGKGSVMRLGDHEHQKIDVISSGSISLDIALGIGGYPKGRIIEIYGPESSGKTTTPPPPAASPVTKPSSSGGNSKPKLPRQKSLGRKGGSSTARTTRSSSARSHSDMMDSVRTIEAGKVPPELKSFITRVGIVADSESRTFREDLPVSDLATQFVNDIMLVCSSFFNHSCQFLLSSLCIQ